VLGKIRVGAGKMPSFASIIAGKEEAIISFLFDKEARSARETNFLKEIAKSESANKDADKFKQEVPVRYLDILSNGKFRDSEGRYGIKPPWTTLNAINLNTGEYAWTIPLGNYPQLQQKGEPETGSEGNTGPIVTAGGLLLSELIWVGLISDSGRMIRIQANYCGTLQFRVAQLRMLQVIRVVRNNT
jgi:quinoprotein glucose dehydrogenase